MQQQNNLVTEIILGIVAGLLTLIGGVLLYVGKIDFSGAIAAWGIAAGVIGVNMAFKAPSPSQQNQLNAQQQNLQQLVSYAFSMLPGLVQSLSQQAQAPVTPPQPAVQSPVPTPVVPPAASPVSQPGTQFKQPVAPQVQIPDVSMPAMMAVGQGIPLEQ